MDKKFSRYTFDARLGSMLRVDFMRMFRMRLIYILLAIALLTPILILVMTTMMDGTVSVNPQTGKETVIEGFDYVWQIIGTTSADAMGGMDMSGMDSNGGMDMSLTAMCNINLLYFAVSVLVCIFVADDFRSGYAKNIFTIRADGTEYIISKTLVTTLGGALMVLAFFLGSLLGGAIAGLPFDMVGFDVANLAMCIASKMLLVFVFVPIYLLMSVIAKDKLWLSIILSLMVSMLLFMMVPMLSPLDSSIMNVLFSAVGGIALATGLGAISRVIIKKTAVV